MKETKPEHEGVALRQIYSQYLSKHKKLTIYHQRTNVVL